MLAVRGKGAFLAAFVRAAGGGAAVVGCPPRAPLPLRLNRAGNRSRVLALLVTAFTSGAVFATAPTAMDLHSPGRGHELGGWGPGRRVQRMATRDTIPSRRRRRQRQLTWSAQEGSEAGYYSHSRYLQTQSRARAVKRGRPRSCWHPLSSPGPPRPGSAAGRGLPGKMRKDQKECGLAEWTLLSCATAGALAQWRQTRKASQHLTARTALTHIKQRNCSGGAQHMCLLRLASASGGTAQRPVAQHAAVASYRIEVKAHEKR